MEEEHFCKRQNENGEWVSCITSQFEEHGFALITESQPPKVEYVEECPFCEQNTSAHGNTSVAEEDENPFYLMMGKHNEPNDGKTLSWNANAPKVVITDDRFVSSQFKEEESQEDAE